MSRTPMLSLILVMTAMGSSAGSSELIEIPRPGHRPLLGVLDVPQTTPRGGFVLAPGMGYDKNQPLMEACARSLAQAGFVVLRFDWGFYTEGIRHSSDGGREAGDLEAARLWLSARPTARDLPLLLGGKSLGSAVILQVTNSGRDVEGLRGLALLTPPCRTRSGNELPPSVSSLADATIPLFIALGSRDPLCDAERLQAVSWSEQTQLLVLSEGDHSLVADSDAQTETNIADCAESLAQWAVAVVGGT